MSSKLGQQIDEYMMRDLLDKRQVQIQAWRARLASKQQRRHIQKKLFGQHYNYSKVGLNKQKKYLIEQQRNTEIQRSNRILLQKIQRISKRSVPLAGRKRIFTQQDQRSLFSDNQSNWMSSKHQQSSHQINKSYDHLERISSNQLKNEPKILFKGSKNFDGKIVLIKTYISNGKFIVAADFGRMKQKMYVQLEHYRMFFKDVLEADHSQILQHLQYNGQVLQLVGINEEKVSVKKREQVILPQILSKTDQEKKNIHQTPKSEKRSIFA